MIKLTNEKIKQINDGLEDGWEFKCEETYQSAYNKISGDKVEHIYNNGKYSFEKSVSGIGDIHSLTCIIYYNKYIEPILHIISFETHFSEYCVAYGYDNLPEIKLGEEQKKRDYFFLKQFTKLCDDNYIKNLKEVKEKVRQLDEDYKNYKG